MVSNLPRTELVMALHMSKELISGAQEHILHSHATQRCILPIGFMEQVQPYPTRLFYIQ